MLLYAKVYHYRFNHNNKESNTSILILSIFQYNYININNIILSLSFVTNLIFLYKKCVSSPNPNTIVLKSASRLHSASQLTPVTQQKLIRLSNTF